ncbi:MAG: MoaD/ThiS family protein [Clostridia bacterium]|nr:MoaD/ThiS family protein [Clostridia bacterium]
MARLHYYAPLRGVIGRETDEAEVATVGDALRFIKTTYGKDAFKCAKAALIVVNGTSMDAYQGRKTILKADDTVGFLPLSGGG